MLQDEDLADQKRIKQELTNCLKEVANEQAIGLAAKHLLKCLKPKKELRKQNKAMWKKHLEEWEIANQSCFKCCQICDPDFKPIKKVIRRMELNKVS